MSQHLWSNPILGIKGMKKEGHLVSGVLAHLGQLHPVVGEVVHHEDKGTHSVHLVAPAGDQDQHEGGVE